jgi:exopolysaccharide biosynthesis polyprenyl glycosylphosphotransferase
MNATERATLLGGFELFDEMTATVDDRTLAILDHRRRTSKVRSRGWLVRRLLLTADLIGLLSALALAEWVANRHNNVGLLDVRAEILAFLASLPCWVVIAKVYGLYDRDQARTDHSTVDDFPAVFHLVTVCTFVFWVAAQLTGTAHPTPTKLIIFWAAAIVLTTVGRAVARFTARRNFAYLQNAVIVGAGDVGQLVAKKILNHPEYGINLVGFIDSQPKERREGLGHLALLGGTDRLPAVIRFFDVERVIIAFSNEGHAATLDLVREMKDRDVQVDIVPRLFELVGPGVEIHTVEGLPVVGLPPLYLSYSSRLLKRCVDLVTSIIGLVVLSPLFLVIAVVIKIDSAGPVFFRQQRMSTNDRSFRIWKFRTMVSDAEERKAGVAHLNRHLAPNGDPRMFKIAGDPRVTRIGRWLRRYSLDELPQLLNVLVGQMTLVGPRPLILDEDRHVRDWARRRLDLKPGITGLWQVMGRDGIPFAEMTRLDYVYVTNWSLWYDIKLLALTVPALFTQSHADG